MKPATDGRKRSQTQSKLRWPEFLFQKSKIICVKRASYDICKEFFWYGIFRSIWYKLYPNPKRSYPFGDVGFLQIEIDSLTFFFSFFDYSPLKIQIYSTNVIVAGSWLKKKQFCQKKNEFKMCCLYLNFTSCKTRFFRKIACNLQGLHSR